MKWIAYAEAGAEIVRLSLDVAVIVGMGGCLKVIFVLNLCLYE